MTKVLSRFAGWLLEAFWKLGVIILNTAVDVVNATIVVIASTFDFLLALLPNAEGVLLALVPPPALLSLAGKINWFIPMDAVAGGLGLICVSYTAFFTARPVAKFLQVA